MNEPQRSTPGSTTALGSAETGSAHALDVAPKVIYVMGAGHSGSTILGLALGNCSDSFYAGEVDEWLLVSGKPSLGGAERAKFWDDVREAMRDSGAQELFGGRVNRLIERSSSLLRFDRWGERRATLRRYRQISAGLFGAIARTAGASHIVDSSHFPLRARELQKADGVELYIVYLVRDPQDVVASNVREISRHEVAERRVRILTMNANLWLTQLLSLLVFLRQPRGRRVFVRHESFIADPEGVLGQIVESLGTGVELPDLGALRAGVALQGNSLIMSQTIAVKRSTRQTARWSRSTELLQGCWGPLLARLRPVATATPRGSDG